MTNVHKHTLIVSGLNEKTNNQTLREIFKRWSAKRCRVVYRNSKSLCWAGIDFTLVNDYNQCLEDTKTGIKLDGRTCTTRPATDDDRAYFEKKKSNFAEKLLSEQQQQTDPEKATFDFGSIEELKNFKFVFIDFESTVTQTGSRYFPREVGVQIYTIGKGDVGYFHRFIDPGPLPLGYASQAKFTTDNIHGIPWNSFELAQKDYKLLWKELCEAICGDDTDNVPFLFAKGKEMEVGSLDILAQKAGAENIFQVHEFEDVIKSLYEHQGVKFNSGDFSLLFPGYYDVDEQCHFHANLQKSYHCALGDAKSLRTVIKKVAEMLSIIPSSTTQKVDPWANYTNPAQSGWESIIQKTKNERNRQEIQTMVVGSTTEPQGVWAERAKKNKDSNPKSKSGWEESDAESSWGETETKWEESAWGNNTGWGTEAKASSNQKSKNKSRDGEARRPDSGVKRRDGWNNESPPCQGKQTDSNEEEWKTASRGGSSRGRGKSTKSPAPNQGGKYAW
eukprot:TRINITY_DN4677_c0_g3_i1.p1 TRINITY_DN4677_c0_g3~~TRINITY_DN4677_c0_g3_i1.p1  ORF type:complete len:504 (-),score=93.96 TRINITY_DN4677_c0_g3_i1:38-1549(-)